MTADAWRPATREEIQQYYTDYFPEKYRSG
ncbi:hypothetical protein SAMN05216388_11151, partial [Halorientalis persicus]